MCLQIHLFTEETTFIADIHADTTLTNSSDRIEVYLLKADYSNSIIDSTSVKYYAGQSSFGLFEVVPAGKYVVAVYPDPFHELLVLMQPNAFLW